jgi:hypothetical protein
LDNFASSGQSFVDGSSCGRAARMVYC